MKKTIILSSIIILTAPAAYLAYAIATPDTVSTALPSQTQPSSTPQNSPINTDMAFVDLKVPFTPEAPDGLMVKPWNNSCEEASVAMLDKYYFGGRSARIPKEEAKKQILNYITIENKIFGHNANTDAAETAKLINGYSRNFSAEIKRNPTLEEIKQELKEDRPVIALVYGYNLNNPRINFARNGSYYHMFVIRGYDDEKQEFIVNDNGDFSKGLDLRYKYDTILGALHDYNYKTQKADGAPTVLFTKQRILAKTANSNRIYLIQDGKKRHITSPAVFKQMGWRWGLVQTVEQSWLDQFEWAN